MANAIVNQAPKELKYKAKETEIFNGERLQEAVVNTEPKESVVNTITVDEVKDIAKKENENTPVLPENVAQIHNFEESTILTDEILAKVKSGDIVKVLQMEFIVNNKINQSPRSITGSIVGAALENSLTILKLDWVKGEALEPASVVYQFSETKSEE